LRDILVFGFNGQVATELRKSNRVIALNRIDANLNNPLSCYEAIKNLNPKAVINAAAFTLVDDAEEQKELSFIVNAEAPRSMAIACKELEIPLVHISTDYVFDGVLAQPLKPSDKTNPLNVYGKSKLKGENYVLESNCIYAILRTSWVFSPFGKNFVKTMLKLSTEREELAIVEDQISAPTSAKSIAKASLCIADELIKDYRKSGIYHYSGQPYVSWLDFAKIIFKITNSNIKIKGINTKDYIQSANRPLNTMLDCSSTQKKFGISRPHWYSDLQETINIIRESE